MKNKILLCLSLIALTLSVSGCNNQKSSIAFGNDKEHDSLNSYISEVTKWNLSKSDFKTGSFSENPIDGYDTSETIKGIEDEINVTYKFDDDDKLISSELKFHANDSQPSAKLLNEVMPTLDENFSLELNKITNQLIGENTYSKLDDDQKGLETLTSNVENKAENVEYLAYYNGDDFEKIVLDVFINDGSMSETSNDAYVILTITNDSEDDILTDEYFYEGAEYEESSSDSYDYSSFYDFETSDDEYVSATYKIGEDLEAGEYKLEASSDGGSYYVSNDSNFEKIVANDSFDTQTYVTVKDGQYLKIFDSKIINN